MKRRRFIVASCYLSTSIWAQTPPLYKTLPSSWLILDEVLEILFPKTSTMPSAKEFGAISYLQEVTSHDSFPKEDKAFIFQGAEDFLSSFPSFLEATAVQKKKFVHSASESAYGASWLEKLVYYGLEAMFGDPIYRGNKNEIGWKSVHHMTGKPQPKVKYAQRVV